MIFKRRKREHQPGGCPGEKDGRRGQEGGLARREGERNRSPSNRESLSKKRTQDLLRREKRKAARIGKQRIRRRRRGEGRRGGKE